jgi:RNA polymerase sigma-70 factor (ECF subfamily)
MLDEDALVKRLQSGDPKAPQELISIFGPRILGSARLLTKDYQSAEELASDTIADAILSIRNFRQSGGLFSWIYGIMLNKFYYHRRRQKREAQLISSLQYIRQSANQTTSNTLVGIKDLIPQFLQKIPSHQREVILLKYLEGKRLEEIAQILRIPRGTVKSRLHNAISRLRKILKKMNLLPRDVTY